MNSCERVMAALDLKEPDKLPWIEEVVDRKAVFPLMGKKPVGVVEGTHDVRTAEEEKEISAFLGRDNITFNAMPPEFCDKTLGTDGVHYYGNGHIRSEEDLDKLKLPDPTKDESYKAAEKFVENKGDFAACAVSRLGLASTYLSLGMENFFIQVIENPPFVIEVLKRYTEWEKATLKRLCEIGFDFLWICDDIAHKSGPMISPTMYRDMFLPYLKEVSEVITIPWLCHSDGNLLLLMDDWLSLGQTAINPIEPQAMDIHYVKATFGHRVCIVGNIDVDLLAQGTPDQVAAEVKKCIHDLAPGGGYILSSGNSIPSYVKPENLLAMSETFKKYRDYPISIEDD